MDKIIDKFRRLTFKRMKGCLTDSESDWMLAATKAFYGGCGPHCMCGGRTPRELSAAVIKKLGG